MIQITTSDHGSCVFCDPVEAVEVDTVAGGDIGGGRGGLCNSVVCVLSGGDGLDTCTDGRAQQSQLTHVVSLRLRGLVYGDALEAEAVLAREVTAGGRLTAIATAHYARTGCAQLESLRVTAKLIQRCRAW